jgi:Fe-S oxidoreductase
MAKLKSEVLQKKYDEGRVTIREKAIFNSAEMARHFSGRMAPIINAIQRSILFRWLAEKIMGIDRRRTLPAYTSETLETWFSNHYRPSGKGKKVVLFNDTYLNFHEPQIGREAIRLLTECGYDIELATIGCCQRPRISNGFLRKAAEEGNSLAEKLNEYINQGLEVVVCEPSCTSALTDDLPDLIENPELANNMKKRIKAIDVFLCEEWEGGRLTGQFIPKETTSILLHGHCHQKASVGLHGMKSIYSGIEGLACTEADSGCCGMAGSFGYEKEHYSISKKIAKLGLLPAIEGAGNSTHIVANGFSCRHQISDFALRKAKHWVETIRFEAD